MRCGETQRETRRDAHVKRPHVGIGLMCLGSVTQPLFVLRDCATAGERGIRDQLEVGRGSQGLSQGRTRKGAE